MFRWSVSILGALFTNTLRRINVNDTLVGDQLTQFLRANANTMILTFCLAQSLFSYHPLILLPPFWSTRLLSEDHQNRKMAVSDQQNPVCLPTVFMAYEAYIHNENTPMQYTAIFHVCKNVHFQMLLFIFWTISILDLVLSFIDKM